MINNIFNNSMHILRFFKSRMGRKHNHKLKLLLMLDHLGKKPISNIANEFKIAKPNMTKIIDKLIKKGLVVRTPNENDRRIINISLSNKGMRLVKEKKKQFKKDLKKAFSDFDKKELEKINESFKNIKKIIDSKGEK